MEESIKVFGESNARFYGIEYVAVPASCDNNCEGCTFDVEHMGTRMCRYLKCNKICRADNTSVIWKIKKPSGKSISEILKMAGQIAKEGIDRLYKEIKRN